MALLWAEPLVMAQKWPYHWVVRGECLAADLGGNLMTQETKTPESGTPEPLTERERTMAKALGEALGLLLQARDVIQELEVSKRAAKAAMEMVAKDTAELIGCACPACQKAMLDKAKQFRDDSAARVAQFKASDDAEPASKQEDPAIVREGDVETITLSPTLNTRPYFIPN